MSGQDSLGSSSSGAVLVRGTGLIGTSVGLALRAAGWQVWLTDPDPRAQKQAAELGAGSVDAPDAETIDIVVVCAPPDLIHHVVIDSLERFPNATVTDVASLKARILEQVAGHVDAARYIGGHPLAGRETSGPGGARSDLFEGRPWVITPVGADAQNVELLRGMVEATGATVVEMEAAQHDSAVAAVSHVPQVMASLTAARLTALDDEALALSGQGLRDVTRIAASDPHMWSHIIGGNADAVVAVLDGIAADLAALRQSLVQDGSRAASAVADLVAQGNAGQARIPGKHGAAAQRYSTVLVVIPDEAGALARLFDVVGDLGVSIEDLALEHSPGQPVGLATLSVLPSTADALMDGLETEGWVVHR